MKHYFPNLNGIRCLAAFAVIIHHTEQIKSWLGLRSYWGRPYISILGGLGVLLFFVLSGFLITYLLLEEKEQTTKISIKKFYIRRILRIWPLYYLIVFLGLFVYPNIHFLDMSPWVKYSFVNLKFKLILFVFFLPNIERFFPGGYYANIVWSVGVEEQFYIIWPHFIKNIKNIPSFLIKFIAFYIIINIIITTTNKLYNPGALDNFIIFYRSLSIDCMAIGGLFAYLYFTKHKLLNFFYKKIVQILSFLILLVLMAFNVNLHVIQNEFYSLLFGILILNLATNKQVIFSLENKVLNYLGKISYGLYMYHFVIVALVLKLMSANNMNNIFLQYIFIIMIVTGVASLSFYYFERYFLRLKKHFN